jgi:hypothetical protein
MYLEKTILNDIIITKDKKVTLCLNEKYMIS